jgi:DNA-binding MarR family transcriptional regulator
MATTPPFTAVLGQTEKALNAILDRHLAGTGLTEHHWIALTLTATSEDGAPLVGRLADALKISEAEARARVSELAAAGLVLDDGLPVRVTDAGRQLHARIRVAVTEITHRMWGDVPADDLATASRVLGTILVRANAELAGAA